MASAFTFSARKKSFLRPEASMASTPFILSYTQNPTNCQGILDLSLSSRSSPEPGRQEVFDVCSREPQLSPVVLKPAGYTDSGAPSTLRCARPVGGAIQGNWPYPRACTPPQKEVSRGTISGVIARVGSKYIYIHTYFYLSKEPQCTSEELEKQRRRAYSKKYREQSKKRASETQAVSSGA